MALWLVRGGRTGEHEQKFFDDSRIYLTWSGALQDVDLSNVKDYDEVKRIVAESYPTVSRGRVINHAGQILAFAASMKSGDWIVLPRKGKPAIAFGEVVGPYTYSPSEPSPYAHWRAVKWLNQDVPRSAFDQDLLFSFGAFMTVCQISRNDAEKRIRAMAQGGWSSAPTFVAPLGKSPAPSTEAAPEATVQPEDSVDLERLARDQIAKLITRRFKGHEMATLVEAVLKAQGYTTFKSPPGADKGVDILAAPGALGFGKPRICVQVKSQDAPVDTPTLNQLIGTMQNMHAEQGLLVAWGGWKSSVEREVANQFFRVRLWDQDALIEEILKHYDALDADLRVELPLKRIWTVAQDEED